VENTKDGTHWASSVHTWWYCNLVLWGYLFFLITKMALACFLMLIVHTCLTLCSTCTFHVTLICFRNSWVLQSNWLSYSFCPFKNIGNLECCVFIISRNSWAPRLLSVVLYFMYCSELLHWHLAMDENLEWDNAYVSLIHGPRNHSNSCPKSPSLHLLFISYVALCWYLYPTNKLQVISLISVYVRESSKLMGILIHLPHFHQDILTTSSLHRLSRALRRKTHWRI